MKASNEIHYSAKNLSAHGCPGVENYLQAIIVYLDEQYEKERKIKEPNNPTEEAAHCYKLFLEYLNTVPPAASGPSVLEIETILDKEIESCCDKSKAAFATYALLIVKGER